MELDSLLSVISGWLTGDGPESDVVVSSRVRLARNLAQYPFLTKAEYHVRQEIEAVLREAIMSTAKDDETAPENPYRDFAYFNVEAMTDIDRQFLVERQLISREHSESSGPRGVVVGHQQQTSLMLNEEDHLRMQVLRSGFNLRECWDEIDKIDDAIESQVAYAFHEQFGYLTACPTNVGTGIRVSVMLHLPALVQTKEIQKVFHAMQKMGLAVRGLYGEGSQAMGDFYQISNQVTLGRSEIEIIELIKDVVPNVIDYERRVRHALVQENQDQLHDQVARAYGILKNAQTISSEETLHLLSSLRMGVNMGLIENPELPLANELFIQTQPAHLQKRYHKELSSAERNTARAGYLRDRLSSIPDDHS